MPYIGLTHVCAVVSDSVTPWTVACQALLSREFSRQDYWSGLSFPSSGDLSIQGLNPCLLHLLHWQAGSLLAKPPGKLIIYILFGLVFTQSNY